MLVGHFPHGGIDQQLNEGLGGEEPTDTTVLVNQSFRQVVLGSVHWWISHHRTLQNPLQNLSNWSLKKLTGTVGKWHEKENILTCIT